MISVGIAVSSTHVRACAVEAGIVRSLTEARWDHSQGVGTALRAVVEAVLPGSVPVRLRVMIDRDLVHIRRLPANGHIARPRPIEPSGRPTVVTEMTSRRGTDILAVAAPADLVTDVFDACRDAALRVRSLGLTSDASARAFGPFDGQFTLRHDWGVELIDVRSGALAGTRRLPFETAALVPRPLQDSGDSTGSYCGALAAALSASAVKLIPPAERSRRRRWMRRTAALAGVATLMVASVTYALMSRLEVRRLSAEHGTLQPAVESLVVVRREIEDNRRMASDIRSVLRKQNSQLARIAALTEALPGSVHLDSFDFRGDSIAVVSGWAPSATRVLAILEQGRATAAPRLVGTVSPDPTNSLERFSITFVWRRG